MKLSVTWTKDKILDEARRAYAELEQRAGRLENELDSEKRMLEALQESSRSGILELRTLVAELEGQIFDADRLRRVSAAEAKTLRNLLVELYGVKR